MFAFISGLSILGSFLYFIAFKQSNYKSDTFLLGFIVCILGLIVCIAFRIFWFFILQLRERLKEQKGEIERLKEQKGEIERLKRQITAPKNTSTDNTTNEDSKKDE